MVNMIPLQLSAEAHQDSEANVAVNPLNTAQIVASAFIPGTGGNCASATIAPVLVSADGGNTWTLECILPSSSPLGGTADITVRFGPLDNTLYAAILSYIGDPTVDGLPFDVLRTTDLSFSAIMSQIYQQAEGPVPCIADQPYIEIGSWAPFPPPGKDRIYVGINDLLLRNNCGGFNGNTANVVLSLDAGTATPTFNEDSLEERSTGTAGQDAPSVRPAVAISSDGVVYAAYIGWRSSISSGTPTSVFSGDIVVVRDDEGGSQLPAFHALKDSDGAMGIRVATQRQFVYDTLGSSFGQERFGSAITIAVDPSNSQLLYLAWTDDMPGAGHVLHLVRGTGSGIAWTPDLFAVSQATNPSIAINSQGVVALLYQQLAACPAGPSCWVTHFVSSGDGFQTTQDLILAATRSDTPLVATWQPYIGDYTHLMAIRTAFYGVFAASNQPTPSNFPLGVLYNRAVDWTSQQLKDTQGNVVAPSIDPFFFSVGAVPRDGELTVRKVLAPSGDQGKFSLQIDSSSPSPCAGNGGTSGPQSVPPNSVHKVTESGCGATSLGSYRTLYGGACDPRGNVFVMASGNVECKITNLGSAHTCGQVCELVKAACEAQATAGSAAQCSQLEQECRSFCTSSHQQCIVNLSNCFVVGRDGKLVVSCQSCVEQFMQCIGK